MIVHAAAAAAAVLAAAAACAEGSGSTTPGRGIPTAAALEGDLVSALQPLVVVLQTAACFMVRTANTTGKQINTSRGPHYCFTPRAPQLRAGTPAGRTRSQFALYRQVLAKYLQNCSFRVHGAAGAADTEVGGCPVSSVRPNTASKIIFSCCGEEWGGEGKGMRTSLQATGKSKGKDYCC